MKNKIILVVVVLMTMLVMVLYREVRSAQDKLATLSSLTAKADTVWVEKQPPTLKAELAHSRTVKRSLGEKIKGTQVIKASEGSGPTVVFKEPVPIDTAVALARIKGGDLSLTLQVPDSTLAHLVNLPVKDVSACKDLELGGNGVVHCTVPRLGILDVFVEVEQPVEARFAPTADVGARWQKNKASSWNIEVHGRPDEWLKGEKKVYVGFTKSLNLLGR